MTRFVTYRDGETENELVAVYAYGTDEGDYVKTEKTVDVRTGSAVVPGDVNGDGAVNNLDAAMIYTFHNGKISGFTF